MFLPVFDFNVYKKRRAKLFRGREIMSCFGTTIYRQCQSNIGIGNNRIVIYSISASATASRIFNEGYLFR